MYTESKKLKHKPSRDYDDDAMIILVTAQHTPFVNLKPTQLYRMTDMFNMF